uniref:Outer membrane protein beta-barrel domain-containing protein n=1 Tax=Candidatus Kentrum sp. LPFa TaxID=2126335 RepID=A0A450XWS8_9GAMM|nr:MAG: Outer membrane protein beta-barrel domain-containing protein [Candidatus Kentron sp. LPFa]VFK33764.1 MAG: Outer membrane protein beta-barrel domain-containing protein [Candidatus Kentron sp. LPFa]
MGKTRPYLSGGVGLARHKVRNKTGSEKDTRFAYQVGVGIMHDLDDDTSVFIGYRYLNTSDAKYSIDSGYEKVDYGLHEVQIGLRYSF